MSVRLEWPSSCIISGPSWAGKTELLFKLITNIRDLYVLQPEQLVYYYGGPWHSAFTPYKNRVKFISGTPVISDYEDSKPTLMILDDLLSQCSEKSANQVITDIFTRDSHHLNISVLLVTQNFFAPCLRTISLNAQYIVLFRNIRDTNQIGVLARHIYGAKKSQVFMEAYDDATSKPYGYLFVDLHPKSNNLLRLRDQILPNELCCVYLSKQQVQSLYKAQDGYDGVFFENEQLGE